MCVCERERDRDRESTVAVCSQQQFLYMEQQKKITFHPVKELRGLTELQVVP